MLKFWATQSADLRFHCQQAIEKCLKAYLASRGRKIRKIHDLRELYDEAVDAEWSLILRAPVLDQISYCAVIVRYPEADDGSLNKRTVATWLRLAKKIFEHALNESV